MTTSMQDLAEAARTLSFAEACNQALDQAMERDDQVFLLGEDISERSGGSFKITRGLTAKYSADRVRDTPISEQAIIGAAIGAAMAGFRPVAEIMLMDFTAVAMDQIVNHAAKLRYMSGGRTNVPLTIRTVVGGGKGFGAQHSQSLEAWFAHVPGLKVVMASTPYDAKGLLLSCIADEDPCIFIENASLLFTQKSPVPECFYTIPLGVGDVKRSGEDISLIVYGSMVPEALTAAKQLEGDGISAEVVDLRTLVPLDWELVRTSVAKCGRALIVHAATQFCGFGAEIAARLGQELFGELKAGPERLGAKFAPNPFAPVLEAELYPNAASIVQRVRQMMGR